MAGSFQLRIVTPTRLLVDEQVREVTAPGTEGEIGILPEHITFLGSLAVGVLTYKSDRGSKRVAIKGGFAEFINEVMTVLADDAVFPEDINVEAARQEAAKLEGELQNLSQYDSKFPDVDTAYRWAKVRSELGLARAA